MIFWDTSALLPLLVDQPASRSSRRICKADPSMAVWWGTAIECASGIARLRREEVVTVQEESSILSLLDDLAASWVEIVPGDPLRTEARRLLRVHPLRAADAMQLAAALVWRRGSGGETVATFDERLALAARLEGFVVMEPEDEIGRQTLPRKRRSRSELADMRPVAPTRALTH